MAQTHIGIWRGIPLFLGAIFTNWFSAMSGSLGVPLAVVGVCWAPGPVKTTLLLTSWVCFAAACYWAWLKEHNAKAQADLRVNLLADNGDPAIRYFRDVRYAELSRGIEGDEWPLGLSVHWIVYTSAWGRWQAAQLQVSVGADSVIRLAESHLLTQLESGLLRTRGIRGESYSYVSPDFWKFRYLMTFPDSRSLIKARIFHRDTTNPADSDDRADDTYHVVVCSRDNLESLFPRNDEAIDAMTKELLARSQTKTT
jgi:hypothetical protein